MTREGIRWGLLYLAVGALWWPGPVNQRTDCALTCLLQGQSYLIPLTTGWPTSP